jgi:hypothetical protein
LFVRQNLIGILSAIDANVHAAGDQAFRFIGTHAFTGVAGQLHFNTNTEDLYVNYGFVEGDVDGDCVADFQIYLHMENFTSVSASAFLL